MTSLVPQPNGINHLALSTADMKGVLQYFNEVLGLPLVALYWMHGAKNVAHGFMALNATSLLAFVYSEDIPDEIEMGKTHSGNPTGPSTKGTMQHLALNVDSLDDLLAVRDRIRSKGVHCFGPMNHGFADSIYFAGPDGVTLEVCALSRSDLDKWIDPKVVEFLDINSTELDALRNPEAFQRPDQPVPQPSMSEARDDLCMAFPPKEYEKIVTMDDETFTKMNSDLIPPTQGDAVN